jgi:hypothetical protein
MILLQFYQTSNWFITSEVILNWNKSHGLIRKKKKYVDKGEVAYASIMFILEFHDKGKLQKKL